MLIDSFAEEWLTQLDVRAEALAPTHRLYLLIDGAFVPGLHRRLAEHAKVLLFESLPSCSEEARDVSPFLTHFHCGDKTLGAMLNRCNRWPMVSVIETPESLGQLAERLSAWCVVEADGQRFNLRFPDTRRLPKILKTLNREQRWQIAGAAERWSYISRDGSWSEIELSPATAEIAIYPALEESQFASLVDDSGADELLAVLSHRGHDVYRHPSRSHALVTTAMRAALKTELGNDELIRWCESFWRHDQLNDEATAGSMFETWLGASL